VTKAFSFALASGTFVWKDSAIRRSPSAAAKIVRRLVPQKHLRAVLKALARSVGLADGASPAKWGLRLNPDSIMLKVGFVQVLQLHEDEFLLLLDKPSVPASLRANRRLRFRRHEYANAPRCGTCDMDIAIVERLYPALLPAHQAAIRVAARRPRRSDTTKDHSRGLVVFVSQQLGVPPPQPEYLEALKNAAPKCRRKFPPMRSSRRERPSRSWSIDMSATRPQGSVALNTTGRPASPAASRFAQRYGPEASGLIHVHHLTPLANLSAQSIVDPVRDLRPLCPNSHAVIHLTHLPRAIEEVRAMLCE
jgi:hypothetical protein